MSLQETFVTTVTNGPVLICSICGHAPHMPGACRWETRRGFFISVCTCGAPTPI